MKVKIEFKPQDLWIGCYWKKVPSWKKEYYGDLRVKLDIWICLVPIIPIHLLFGSKDKR